MSANNPAVWRGRPFWSGAFDVLDGQILEVHSYEQAEQSDFHHNFYFSDRMLRKMRDGEAQFFWVEGPLFGKPGVINTKWREGEAPRHIVAAIRRQITFTDGKESPMSDCAPCEAARLEAGLGDAARLLEKHFNASAAVDYVLALATTIARRDKVPCSQIRDSLEQMIALLRRAAPMYRPGHLGKKYEQAVRAYNHLREVALKSC